MCILNMISVLNMWRTCLCNCASIKLCKCFTRSCCFIEAKVTLTGHENNIRAAIFAHFDKQIISASDDKTVR